MEAPVALAPREFEQIRQLAYRSFGLDLKSGKADKYRPTKIDEAWLNEMPPPDKDDAPPPLVTTEPPAGAAAE